MKIGLVHGRFQPFHNRHKELVDQALKECDRVAIIIGISQKANHLYPYRYHEVVQMIESVYPNSSRDDIIGYPPICIGANLDIDRTQESLQTRWDILMATACISACGYLPTDVYGGNDYRITWSNVPVNLHISDRGGFGAGDIREAIVKRDEAVLDRLLPEPVKKLVLSWRLVPDLINSNYFYDNVEMISGVN